jgi:hypothetical protein
MKIAVSGYKCLNDINEFVEIRDITLITGKNSSGKSSFSEAFDFFSKFSNLAFAKTTFIKWFEIEINSSIFPNINEFFDGIDKINQKFEIAIKEREGIELILTFAFDENGFNIILNNIEVQNFKSTILSLNRKQTKTESFITQILTEYTLFSNIENALKSTLPSIRTLLNAIREYLKDNLGKDEEFIIDEEKFNSWFNNKYTKTEFFKLISNKSDLDAYLKKFNLPKMESVEFDLILEQIKKDKVFFNWHSDKTFPENLFMKLFTFEYFLEEDLKNRFQTKYFPKVIHLFYDENFKNYITDLSETENLESVFEFQLSTENKKYFSLDEIDLLRDFWQSKISETLDSFYLPSGNPTSTISFLRKSSFNSLIRTEINKEDVKDFLWSININKKNTSFSNSQRPLETLFNQSYFNYESNTSKIDGELWFERCKELNETISNIWQAYLFLEFKISGSVEMVQGQYEEHEDFVEVIDIPMNRQFALSSICFEYIGNMITNDFIPKIESETIPIKGNSFNEIWANSNLKQKLAFQKNFEIIKLNDITFRSVIKTITDGVNIDFHFNQEYNDLDLHILDEKGNIKKLDSLGSGHVNIINIGLEFLYHFTVAMNSNKKHLNVILVEPERFLHPNLNSSLVELISFLNEFPKGNISILKALPLKINILIETHSEYLIRSFQSKIARNKENNYVHNTLTINYLSKNKLKNSTSIRQIYIDNDGSLSDEFGSGFLDETELIIRNILNSRK